MIRTVAIAGLAALAATLATTCSFDRRSGQFRCDEGQSCGTGRVCQAGWCVEMIAGDAGSDPDADPAIDASFVCPSECTSCEGESCLIDCSVTGSCAIEVMCPTGLACNVTCGASACAGGIDCSQAADCVIQCPFNQSCSGPILCGTGSCDVQCGGPDSCTGGIDCSNACACDTACDGAGSCTTAPQCTDPTKCHSGIDCSSATGNCDSC